ncbi:hypothetical protein UCRPA7_1925 [Phaeoacremonium minimum UCRPA7]|uniref:Uncharacterized protein n=1 Tax=Phaeoacremonium minimum (strain UCR-PA7) TaxID=1286976 RepID=R8BT66_PHAM7|nr:hypothetical protein UCRPA7_1925 [Phaeoacremonium minimum UCRPA7]EOO02541.1 hypothetical protein UCRPA7_1925 [Phaeoacremonium minimum UCRPA7]
MFGSFANLIPAPTAPARPPKDVPPPTPVNFPHCEPKAGESGGGDRPASSEPATPVTSLLQSIIRPTEISVSHFEALGIHVIPDAEPKDIIPDPAYIPDFEQWDSLSQEEARDANEKVRQPLNNGALSPGLLVYLDRKRELSTQNELAFRAVRRMQPPPGKTQVRLGNSFEFFRNLEAFGTFWDDTSAPKPPDSPEAKPKEEDKGEAASSASDSDSEKTAQEGPVFFRTGAGYQMPPEYRINLITAFLKLVAYDFGCNVSAPRTEPRLYMTAPQSTPTSQPGAPPRSSYFSSGCTFIFRTPRTREQARAGIVEGPLAAVSTRHSTSFPPPPPPPSSETESPTSSSAADLDSTIDFAREIIAALVTAQHRAREGRTEKRIGEDAWWATKPRWGGGPGGPIGREVDFKNGDDIALGDKDAPPPQPASSSSSSSAAAILAGNGRSSSSSSSRDRQPLAKKARKNMAIYDNYRMIRPPSAAWDKKTKYMAIGRRRGADHDDVFVVSALFHHISILRVKVPARLLEVFDGAPDVAGGGGARSWGTVEVLRSRWYDFFRADERVEAMRLVWSMMAYLMRKEDEEDGDVKMADA